MPSTGLPALNQVLGGTGYPEKSAVLVVGPPGIGKEALGYWFVKSGLEQGDFCLYATRLSAEEVLQDQRAFGVDNPAGSLTWLESKDGLKLNANDLAGSLDIILGVLRKNGSRRIRIVVDFLSTLLLLNTVESVYRFASQLIDEVKRYDAVLVATIEESMHSPEVLASMVQLFDGFIEISFYRTGLKILPLLRVGKMRGLAPQPEYFRMKFSHSAMLLEKTTEAVAVSSGVSVPESVAASPPDESGAQTALMGKEAGIVFQYLLKSFVDDYLTLRLSIDQSGWRTRGEIADSTNVPRMVLYGRESTYGPILKELFSKGLVEQRFFAGQRGRGGEVIKFRIAYEKELVKRFVEKARSGRGEHP